jgi:tetratricopeptide (TPR) repeat protein
MSFEDDEYWDEQYSDNSSVAYVENTAVAHDRYAARRTHADSVLPTRRPGRESGRRDDLIEPVDSEAFVDLGLAEAGDGGFDELAVRRRRRENVYQRSANRDKRIQSAFDSARPGWLDDPDFVPPDVSGPNLAGPDSDLLDVNRPELGANFDEPDAGYTPDLPGDGRQRRSMSGRPGDRFDDVDMPGYDQRVYRDRERDDIARGFGYPDSDVSQRDDRARSARDHRSRPDRVGDGRIGRDDRRRADNGPGRDGRDRYADAERNDRFADPGPERDDRRRYADGRPGGDGPAAFADSDDGRVTFIAPDVDRAGPADRDRNGRVAFTDLEDQDGPIRPVGGRRRRAPGPRPDDRDRHESGQPATGRARVPLPPAEAEPDDDVLAVYRPPREAARADERRSGDRRHDVGRPEEDRRGPAAQGRATPASPPVRPDHPWAPFLDDPAALPAADADAARGEQREGDGPRVLSKTTPPTTPRVISKAAPPPTPKVVKKADPPATPRVVTASPLTAPARVVAPAPAPPVAPAAAAADPAPPAVPAASAMPAAGIAQPPAGWAPPSPRSGRHGEGRVAYFDAEGRPTPPPPSAPLPHPISPAASSRLAPAPGQVRPEVEPVAVPPAMEPSQVQQRVEPTPINGGTPRTVDESGPPAGVVEDAVPIGRLVISGPDNPRHYADADLNAGWFAAKPKPKPTSESTSEPASDPASEPMSKATTVPETGTDRPDAAENHGAEQQEAIPTPRRPAHDRDGNGGGVVVDLDITGLFRGFGVTAEQAIIVPSPPAERRPAEQPPAEQQPAEQRAAEQQAAEQLSPYQQAADQPGPVGEAGPDRLALNPGGPTPTEPQHAARPITPLSAEDLEAIRWRLDGASLREVIDDRDALRELGGRLDGPLAEESDHVTRAGLLSVRAEVYRLLGELGLAAAASRLALAHGEASGDVRAMVIAQAELAHVLRLRGDFAEADRLFEEAASSEAPEVLRCVVHENAGRSCFDQGRQMEALDHFARAIRLGEPDDIDLVERIDVSLEAVYIHVLRDGWGPYPRLRREILGQVRAHGDGGATPVKAGEFA